MLSKTTRTVTAAASIALAMTATACDPQKTDKNVAVPEASKPHPSAMAHKYKRNPDPKRHYEVTMTIADAPGPFDSVEGFAQYEAPDCVFTLDSVAGVHSIPRYRMPIDYRKVDESTYVGAIYLDAMLDEDYFGNGACHWKFTSTTVVLKATGAHAETGFVPSIDHDQMVAQQPTSSYFMKQFYPRVEKLDDFSEFGQTDRSQFASYIEDDDLFTIALMPKEAQQ